MTIGLCVIATRKYKQFVQPLLEGVEKYFMPNHKLVVFIFTDDPRIELKASSRLLLLISEIPDYKFPFASLYRYKIFNERKNLLSNADHIFYSDADMKFVDMVSDAILSDGLTLVRHPGFFVSGGWGSPNVSEKSTAWVEPSKRYDYFCGGFNGAKTSVFLDMCETLDKNITIDENNGVMAEYHDESHLNAYVKNVFNGVKLELTPSYCMPAPIHLRSAWGLDGLEPKILALEKDHKLIRE